MEKEILVAVREGKNSESLEELIDYFKNQDYSIKFKTFQDKGPVASIEYFI